MSGNDTVSGNVRFSYRILTLAGEVREGVEEAVSVPVLRAQLEQQGHCVLWIHGRSTWDRFWPLAGTWNQRVSDRDLQLFSKEMAILLRAGLPLAVSLKHLVTHMRAGRFRTLVEQAVGAIEGGRSFSEALEDASVFPPLYVAAIRSGESSDTLEAVLLRLHDHFQLVGQIRQKVRAALIYPAFLLLITALAVSYLLTVVVPVFEKLYIEVGHGLPWMTQQLLLLSHFIRRGWWMTSVMVVGGWIAWRQWGRQGWLKAVMDEVWLHIPTFGNILKEYAISQFMRTFAMLLKSGVAVPSALKTAGAVVTITPLQRALARVGTEVEGGASLAEAFQQVKSLPSLAVQMVHTGEQTGALDELCQSVAELMEEELQVHLNTLLALLEPLLMTVLGVVIALVLLAMYLPIFELSSQVGG